MHPIRAARRVVESQLGPLDMICIEGGATRYVKGRYWDFAGAASAFGKVHLYRFRLHFTYTHWLWDVLDIGALQRWRVLDLHTCEVSAADDDPFRVLGLSQERDEAVSVPSSWRWHHPYAGNHLLLDAAGVHREWRSIWDRRPTLNSRRIHKLRASLTMLVYSRLGVHNYM